jgi:hypothetical protein
MRSPLRELSLIFVSQSRGAVHHSDPFSQTPFLKVYKAGFWEKVRRGPNWQPFYDLYGFYATTIGIGVIKFLAEIESESLFQPNLFSLPRYRP